MLTEGIDRRATRTQRRNWRIGGSRGADDVSIRIAHGVDCVEEILLIEFGITAGNLGPSVVDKSLEPPILARQYPELAVEPADQPNHFRLASRDARRQVGARPAQVEIILLGNKAKVLVGKRVAGDRIGNCGPRRLREKWIVERDDEVAVARSRRIKQAGIVDRLRREVATLADTIPALAEKAQIVRQIIGQLSIGTVPLEVGQQVFHSRQ